MGGAGKGQAIKYNAPPVENDKEPIFQETREAHNGRVIGDTKETELVIDGMKYTITSKRKTTPSADQKFNLKFQANIEKQMEEVNKLGLLYKDRFKSEDDLNKKYSIKFFIGGGLDASIQFSFPPEYPSDVPPTYTFSASWMRKNLRTELYKALSDIFSENFGRCIVDLWVHKIGEILKKEIQELKENPQQEEERRVHTPTKLVPREENLPEIYTGNPIWDRGSCFSPYLAKVCSDSDVKKVIAKVEDRRKVSSAWRNTYAYRYVNSTGKMVELGEDGGEPKAGRNLLQRLINYKANNVIVYISRRVGGSLLGSDRFKHLNDAADDVLAACGYKIFSQEPKYAKQESKKNKKAKSKK